MTIAAWVRSEANNPAPHTELACRVMALGAFDPKVKDYWLAAAPVVALGAPLGSLFVDRIGRGPTLVFVSLLCLGQFVWTMHHELERLGALGIAVSVLSVAAANVGFILLYVSASAGIDAERAPVFTPRGLIVRFKGRCTLRRFEPHLAQRVAVRRCVGLSLISPSASRCAATLSGLAVPRR